MKRTLLATMATQLTILVLFGVAATSSPAQQPAAGQPAQPQQQATPRNPFQLTPQEQAYLDQVLKAWETETAKIKTFTAPFTRFTYNAFSPAPNIAFTQEVGKVSYQKPDKGSFKIDEIRQWQATPVAPGQQPAPGQPPQGQHVPLKPAQHGDAAIGDHWVSDGRNVYEYRQQSKTLSVTPIPPELQGAQIVNGPFPFLFGAKANDLKQRYWMRIHPHPDPNVIQIVALPKTRAGAAEYRAVELQLDRQRLLPRAMKIHRTDSSQDVFAFEVDRVSVNRPVDRLWSALFQSPRTPRGWTLVVNDPNARQAANPRPAGR